MHNAIQDVKQACAVGVKTKKLASKQITLCLSMFKVNEIIHLYVNLSVLKIQIENKHVAAMDCFIIVGHCWILPT